MKILFKNSDKVKEGISILAEDIGVTPVASEADITVSVSELEEDRLEVSLKGDSAAIAYGGGTARFFRGLATLVGWIRDGIGEREESLCPTFSLNGSMVDMSRNAVMNVKTVKFMMRKMALMGMNAFMLYTEDTYEIEGRPYFGYMRGRYSADEIKELDSYAEKLGIELIPCIQTLGHLATALRWGAADKYRDTSDVLFVGAEETYQLIDDMLRTVSSCFKSRRVHIGMDETHSLGTGRSLDKNGYHPHEELYLEHLNRVAKMAEDHGLEPMMWSDMFFRMSGKGLPNLRDYDVRAVITDRIKQLFPKNVKPVFWDYYNPTEEFYSINIDKHAQLGDGTIFAGGVWMWSGHCPLFSRSIRHTVPALEACRKKGIREVLATVWHNGSEAPLILAVAGLAIYADYDYYGGYDPESVAKCFRYATGESYEDFLKVELPEHPNENVVASSRALLYNDPLLGMVDRHAEQIETASYYKKVLGELSPLGDYYAPAFRTIRALTDLLVNKADFGVRLKRAYDNGDKEALASMAEECDIIIEKINTLRAEHKGAWMTYNKPFGWEVHDTRYGGLTARFETAKERILAYLSGELEAIEELECERLRIDCLPEDSDPFGSKFLWMRHQSFITAGILS